MTDTVFVFMSCTGHIILDFINTRCELYFKADPEYLCRLERNRSTLCCNDQHFTSGLMIATMETLNVCYKVKFLP